jgi:hypothetical protein
MRPSSYTNEAKLPLTTIMYPMGYKSKLLSEQVTNMHRILAVGEIHRLGYVKPQHSNEGLTTLSNYTALNGMITCESIVKNVGKWL